MNFQGSEIVGLSAAETQDPETNVPAACKKVAFRIICIYVIPVFLLDPNLSLMRKQDSVESIFAATLGAYGLNWAAGLFTDHHFDCSIQLRKFGFLWDDPRYVRSWQSKAWHRNSCPELNRFGVPQNATLFTIIPVWLVFLLGFFATVLGSGSGGGGTLYTYLLGVSGFAGTLCWVGLLWSQMVMRRKLKARGYNPEEVLTVKARWYPGLAIFSIIVQVGAMVLLVFEDLTVFFISLFVVVLPIVVFVIQKKRGKIRATVSLGSDEVLFDEKFPIQK